MNTLINSVQVVRLAFAPDECLPPDAVADADIAAAEARYLVPVIGAALHRRLLQADDRTFVDEWLAAPLALFTRVLLQPRLDIRAGRGGTTAPKSDHTAAAGPAACRAMRSALLTEARALLRRAVARIEADPEAFPEYEPAHNILKHCSIDGKLVQTR